jgi:hypothetical protein
MSVRSFKVLKKMLSILGCMTFLFSITSPFYYVNFLTWSGGGETYFWSYKADYHDSLPFPPRTDQYWFLGYWSSIYSPSPLGMLFISMFTIQALGLFFGTVSVISKRRLLSFAPVLLCLTVLTLMIFTGKTISQQGSSFQKGLIDFADYQLGYYFVYTSLVLFLSPFVLNEIARRRQTKLIGNSDMLTTGQKHPNNQTQ